MRLVIVLLTAAVLLAAPASLHAATWYVDPAKGAADGDGSAAKPWRTLQEIASNGTLAKIVKPGDTVLLRSGYHGDVSFSGTNSDYITIAAAEGQKPQLSRLVITGGEKWRVKGLAISPSFGGQPYKGNIVTFGENADSKDLIVEDCFIYTELESADWDVQKWKSVNGGVNMGRNGKNLVLRNCYILNTRFGVAMCSFDSTCEGSVINNFSGDGIRVTRDGQTVRYNVIRNNFAGAADGDDNHDDGIQCFLFNKGHGTVRKVTVVGNIIINRDDDRQKWHNPLQAIGFFDGPLVDFVVTDNVVGVDMWHGVSLYDAENCRIERNVCWSRWQTNRLPWVRLGGKGKGNAVKDNYACSFRIDQPETTAANNNPSTEEIYNKALADLNDKICKEFGTLHPVAGLPRLAKPQPAEKPAAAQTAESAAR